MGSKYKAVNGEGLQLRLTDLAVTIWPTKLAGIGEKPGLMIKGCCRAGKDEGGDTLADEEVPKTHKGRRRR